jgi:uncharacterized membrane protein YkoI
MRFATRILGIVVMMGLLVSAARADEKKIKLDKLPKAVVDAVKDKFPDAKLTKATEETEKGVTIYKVSLTYKDHKHEAEFKKDGTLAAVSRQIEAKEMPKKVAEGLEGKYPKARINLIEEVIVDDKVHHYEVALVTADKKEVDVEIDLDGKVLKEEKSDKD